MTSARRIIDAPARVRHFTTPKSGHTLAECEDAIGISDTRQRLAVVDGATEAFDSGRWARQLAETWVQQSQLLAPEDFWTWLGQQGAHFAAAWSELQLSWYSEEKARAGSFAAFVGVELDLTTARWNGIALGDSCFFHFRESELLTTLPAITESSFTSTPVLAPSFTALQPNALKEVVTGSGELAVHDVLMLCSDALAAWTISLVHKQRIPSELFFVANDEEVVSFFNDERTAGRLKDDDLSFIVIEI
jgi:hypothetical protein